MSIGLPEILFVLVFGLGSIFWIWMLIDAATHEKNAQDRILWVLIIIFTHVIGAAIYFFVRRGARLKLPR
jgi:heme/copper-type cytochrome/quinol oxidase subunit 2